MPFLDRRHTDASALIAFHTAAGTDRGGRTIEDVWDLGLEALERTHDYIQWLFPVDEPSRAQPSSPVLTSEAIEAIRRSPLATARLLRSANVMAAFYGFEILHVHVTCSSWRVVRTASFAARGAVWLTPGNHNFLRQTRILRALMLLGQRDLARAWFACLAALYGEHRDTIGEETFAYWTAAVADA